MIAAEKAWADSLAAVSVADLADGLDRKARGTALPMMREWVAAGA